MSQHVNLFADIMVYEKRIKNRFWGLINCIYSFFTVFDIEKRYIIAAIIMFEIILISAEFSVRYILILNKTAPTANNASDTIIMICENIGVKIDL